ncbi:MAG: glutamate--tRNA ligase [Candidatus Pacebacteria bacterium]|nr:glutamate--tRNA ligase [Candidatus Paceibacterota bacterium]
MDSQLTLKKSHGIKVRFAPSPTGYLHLGGARTALFNYLWAKKNQGTFILRIEDTDKERSKEEFEKDIIENLKWLGIAWDEGPEIDSKQTGKEVGENGPYRQSEREKIYKKYIKKLYDDGFLYWCFCTKEELEAQKADQAARGESPKYIGGCKNIKKEEAEKLKKEGKTAVLRIKCPTKTISINDAIRGKVEFDTSLLGDFVVARDFKTPLYNLAVVIDDHEMKVNYIIRGEDHLSNTPKQAVLQESLNFQNPKYAHIPLILAKDRSKLSKRHGSFAVEDFKKEGYLAEAIVNYLALLGWNPDTEEEFFSLEDLIQNFSIEQVQKSGAVFNKEKLDNINSYYIKTSPKEDIAEKCIPFLEKAELIEKTKNGAIKEFKIKETEEIIDINFLSNVVALFQERMKKLSEIASLSDFFFKKELSYGKDLLKWKGADFVDIQKNLKECYNILEKFKEEEWNREKIEEVLMDVAEKKENRGVFLWPIRAALSGKEASPSPFEIAEVLGKEKTLERIQKSIKILNE